MTEQAGKNRPPPYERRFLPEFEFHKPKGADILAPVDTTEGLFTLWTESNRSGRLRFPYTVISYDCAVCLQWLLRVDILEIPEWQWVLDGGTTQGWSIVFVSHRPMGAEAAVYVPFTGSVARLS